MNNTHEIQFIEKYLHSLYYYRTFMSLKQVYEQKKKKKGVL